MKIYKELRASINNNTLTFIAYTYLELEFLGMETIIKSTM